MDFNSDFRMARELAIDFLCRAGGVPDNETTKHRAPGGKGYADPAGFLLG